MHTKSVFLVFLAVMLIVAPAMAFSGEGEGTTENPYLVSTPAQFLEIQDGLTSAKYKLTDDLDMTGHIWVTPQNQNTEHKGFYIQGGNHVVSNLTITGYTLADDGTTRYYGMFGYPSGKARVVISDIAFNNMTLVANVSGAGEVYAGFFVGKIRGAGANTNSARFDANQVVITNSQIKIEGDGDHNHMFVGTLAGCIGKYTFGTISRVSVINSVFDVRVLNSENLIEGGIAGRCEQYNNYIQISECSVQALDLYSETLCGGGGLVGILNTDTINTIITSPLSYYLDTSRRVVIGYGSTPPWTLYPVNTFGAYAVPIDYFNAPGAAAFADKDTFTGFTFGENRWAMSDPGGIAHGNPVPIGFASLLLPAAPTFSVSTLNTQVLQPVTVTWSEPSGSTWSHNMQVYDPTGKTYQSVKANSGNITFHPSMPGEYEVKFTYTDAAGTHTPRNETVSIGNPTIVGGFTHAVYAEGETVKWKVSSSTPGYDRYSFYLLDANTSDLISSWLLLASLPTTQTLNGLAPGEYALYMTVMTSEPPGASEQFLVDTIEVVEELPEPAPTLIGELSPGAAFGKKVTLDWGVNTILPTLPVAGEDIVGYRIWVGDENNTAIVSESFTATSTTGSHIFVPRVKDSINPRTAQAHLVAILSGIGELGAEEELGRVDLGLIGWEESEVLTLDPPAGTMEIGTPFSFTVALNSLNGVYSVVDAAPVPVYIESTVTGGVASALTSVDSLPWTLTETGGLVVTYEQPTGWEQAGKTVTYRVIALSSDGQTLLVDPIVAWHTQLPVTEGLVTFKDIKNGRVINSGQTGTEYAFSIIHPKLTPPDPNGEVTYSVFIEKYDPVTKTWALPEDGGLLVGEPVDPGVDNPEYYIPMRVGEEGQFRGVVIYVQDGAIFATTISTGVINVHQNWLNPTVWSDTGADIFGIPGGALKTLLGALCVIAFAASPPFLFRNTHPTVIILAAVLGLVVAVALTLIDFWVLIVVVMIAAALVIFGVRGGGISLGGDAGPDVNFYNTGSGGGGSGGGGDGGTPPALPPTPPPDGGGEPWRRGDVVRLVPTRQKGPDGGTVFQIPPKTYVAREAKQKFLRRRGGDRL